MGRRGHAGPNARSIKQAFGLNKRINHKANLRLMRLTLESSQQYYLPIAVALIFALQR